MSPNSSASPASDFFKQLLGPDHGAHSPRSRELLAIDAALCGRNVSTAVYSHSASPARTNYYDVVRDGTDGILLVVADMLGENVSIAHCALQLRLSLRQRGDLLRSPGKMLAHLNHMLLTLLAGANVLVSAQLVYFDRRKGAILVASAGHCPPLLACEGSGQLAEVYSDGSILGLTQNPIFLEERMSSSRPARLLMMTDGYVNAPTQSGEALGTEKIGEAFLVAARHHRTAEDMRDTVALLASPPIKPAQDQTFLLLAESPLL